MKERYAYIDICRGLCMLIVIYSHLLLFSLGYPHCSLLTDFLRGFFLNSFFFISGFISYKERNWNISNTKSFLVKKVKTLLVPSFISLGFFCFIVNGNYINALIGSSKSGYWFTFVLFEMFFLYASIFAVTNNIKSKKWKTIFLLILAIMSYAFKKMLVEEELIFNILSLDNLLYYFPLFLLGTICRINIELFYEIIDRKFIKILLFIIVCLKLLCHCIPLIIYNVSITLFVFYMIKDIITTGTNSNTIYKYSTSVLQRIGQNTLPIYFLHYFILFKYPKSLCNYLQGLYSDTCFAGNSCAGFVELIIIGMTSLLIAVTCIYMAKLLSYVPYLNTLMFGIEMKNKH